VNHNADRHPHSPSVRRDTILGGGLVAAFALLVASTVWPMGYDGSVGRIVALCFVTTTVAIALTVLLWRRPNDRLLVLFPLALYAAEIALALLTDGVSPGYSGFFALSIIYVGLTQRASVVRWITAAAAPCWLICQEHVTAAVVMRFCLATLFWLVVGYALATRTEMSRARTAELIDRANTDALTGLASRLCLSDHIDGILAGTAITDSPSEATVMVVDLDGFKAVNDMFGHAVGDGLLVAVATWMRASFRPADTCARLGGDEFAVLLRDTTVDQAQVAAARLLQQMAKPVDLPRGQIAITASVGIARVGHALDGQEVLHEADLAMYEAKAAGRNRVCVYVPEMGARRAARLQLEAELVQGLEQQQFELFYQPVVNLQTRALIGAEALLRWNHPTRGLLAPDQFLHASEEIGVMVTLGDWVLRQACEQAVRWQPSDPGMAVSMAINVSASELLAADFVSRVDEVLRSTGLPGRLLILEITERLVVSDVQLVRERIVELRRLGVRIAIDDFGTGYSSIAYLRDLPIDIIKIDQSFVRPLGQDTQTGALLKAIVAVADALHVAIVAEGVESEHHVAVLRGLGCEVAQGYHFARPANAATISELLGGHASTRVV
jgi:diguanylate cyclase (GGDEF)-like protein